MEHCSEIVEATCFLLDRLGSWRLCYYSDTLDNFWHFQIRPHSTSCWVVTFGKGENNGRGFWEVNLSLKFRNRFFLGYCVKWKYILRRCFTYEMPFFSFFSYFVFSKICMLFPSPNCPTIFFSVWVFFHEHSRIIGLQGKGEEGISLTPHYHFHPLHRHLDINRAITAECLPLHIASGRTRTGNLWFPIASR